MNMHSISTKLNPPRRRVLHETKCLELLTTLLISNLMLFVPNTSSQTQPQQQQQQQQQQHNAGSTDINNTCFKSSINMNGIVVVEQCRTEEDFINFNLQKAMAKAWEDYGPNSKYKVLENNPGRRSGSISNSNNQNHISHRDTISTLNDGFNLYAPSTTNSNSRRSPPLGTSPASLSATNFQPVTSEWDQNVQPYPLRTHEIVEQPGLFSRILAQYVSFEINHHEIADFFRQVAFSLFIGVIILGWVVLGFLIGFLPLKWLLISGRSDEAAKDFDTSATSSSILGKGIHNDEIFRSITERVLLALDGDWLKRLEEKVQIGNKNGKWLRTNVYCCILPDTKTVGVAECELVRKARKLSTFKCLSDLIYSFQFGPNNSYDLTLEGSQLDNIVNAKSSSGRLNDDDDDDEIPKDKEFLGPKF